MTAQRRYDWGDEPRSSVRDFIEAVGIVVLVFGSLILAAWADLGGRG